MTLATLAVAATLSFLPAEPSVDCSTLSIVPMIHLVSVEHRTQVTWDDQEITERQLTSNVAREAALAKKDRDKRGFERLIVIRYDADSQATALKFANEIRRAGLKFGKRCPYVIDTFEE
jgi:hypothetical protein